MPKRRRPPTASRAGPEHWIPLVYAAAAGAWIAFSDLALQAFSRSIGEQAAVSMLKGFGFVAVTALLLHAWIRRALLRERTARAALEKSEALLRAVTDSLQECVFLKDRGSRWLFANPATLRVIGKTEAEVLGRDDRAIYADPAVGDALMEIDRRIMDSGIAEVLEEKIQTPDGYRVFLSAKAPFRDATGAVVGVVGNSRDVTERRKLEEQLRQAQRLEGIGRLAGGVAHDFNNLLTVILSCAEGLETAVRGGGPPDVEEVAEIRGAAERARDLTRQLLAVARRQPIAPVTLDLNDCVRRSERLLRRVLGEDVDLRVRLDPHPVCIRGDAGQVEQVILNLAVNARDAMPSGGALEIETRARALAPPDVPGEGGPPADGRPVESWSGFSVRDTGSGMTPEVKEHLFEPFFTTKPGGRGSGLGLATVYGIVSQNGGRIRVDSEPGRGTLVEVFLPRAEEAPLAPEPAPPPRAGPSRARPEETVLVVEDEGAVREVTVRSLRGAGYRVLDAADGPEAMVLDDSTLRGVDLLVTDVVLPGPDGRAVADALRARHPGLRVLFVSGYTRDGISARGVLANGVDLLEKPFTPSTLLARVREALDASPGGRYPAATG